MARTVPDPPLTIVTEEISAAADDGTGYLIVHIPASPVAPHMVDNRYFGRGDKTKYQMGDAEVVSLHARRRNTEADTLALLRKEMDEDPLRDVGAQSHLFLAAQPTAGRRDMCLPLMGQWHGPGLNAVWRNFLGSGSRVRHTPDSMGALRAQQAADLRATAARYPADPRLHRLITTLRARSPLFEELWQDAPATPHRGARKTIDHPSVGAITLDCDVLHTAGSDLHVMVYTAEPGTEGADRLAVIGTQALVG
ncbi:hypothetical protein [Streptomyces sp. NPDC059455]|uniref:MmyB family transcriptional regulator n=1 Tax=Streptomyces sp. NPDC059455 TaxID=3346837 RepID=UPI0036CFD678